MADPHPKTAQASSDSVSPPPKPRRSWTRWIGLGFAAVVLLTLASVILLPQITQHPTIQQALITWMDRALAPGHLRIERIELAWFRPTQLHGVVLIDRHDTEVLRAPRVGWSRSLESFLLDRQRPVANRFTLGNGSKVQITRRRDGSIDLLDALDPLIRDNPRSDAGVVIDQGRFVVHDAWLAEPIRAAGTLRLEIGKVSESDAITQQIDWFLDLDHDNSNRTNPAAESSARFVSRGSLLTDPEAALSGLQAELEMEGWPLAVRRGLDDPATGIERPVTQARLRGDLRLSLDDDQPVQIEGSLSVDQLRDPALPKDLDHLELSGTVEAVSADRPDAAVVDIDALQVALALSCPYGNLAVGGRVDAGLAPNNAQADDLQVDVRGTWEADPTRFDPWLAKQLPDGVAMDWGPGQFVLAGPVSRDLLAGRAAFDRVAIDRLQTEVSLLIDRLEGMGLQVGPAEWRVVSEGGRVRMPPTEATLNGGRIRLAAEIAPIDAEIASGGWIITLDPEESWILDAEVDDEVSRRFLAYVAPVLNNATRVQGRVSAALDQAWWPVGVPELSGGEVEGTVLFDEVTFRAGPLVEVILVAVRRIAPRMPEPKLELDQPVILRIADDQVTHTGLYLPIGDLNRIQFEGAVGFDRSMALDAHFPLLGKYMSRNRILSGIAGNTELTVPIRGTLDKPQLDGDALADALGDTGKQMLRRGAAVGISELFRLITGPDEDRPE